MPSFNQDIANLARRNSFFRQEVVTGSHSQVVLMSIPRGGEIGEETHPDVDQTLIFVEGHGKAILNGEQSQVGRTAYASCLLEPGTISSIQATPTSSSTPFTPRRSTRLVLYIRPKPKPMLTLPSTTSTSREDPARLLRHVTTQVLRLH